MVIFIKSKTYMLFLTQPVLINPYLFEHTVFKIFFSKVIETCIFVYSVHQKYFFAFHICSPFSQSIFKTDTYQPIISVLAMMNTFSLNYDNYDSIIQLLIYLLRMGLLFLVYVVMVTYVNLCCNDLNNVCHTSLIECHGNDII